MMKSSALARRIGKRMVREGRWRDGLVHIEGMVIQRVRPGHHMRSAGAWSWYIRYLDREGKEIHGPRLGSQWAASEVIAWPEWNIYQGSIDPC